MKVKHLKQGEIRAISIGREAIYELLRETMMENSAEYFDILGNTVMFEMRWNSKTEIFTCAVFDRKYPPDDLDFDTLEKHLGLTTETLYQRNRYKTVCIKDMQAEKEELT